MIELGLPKNSCAAEDHVSVLGYAQDLRSALLCLSKAQNGAGDIFVSVISAEGSHSGSSCFIRIIFGVAGGVGARVDNVEYNLTTSEVKRMSATGLMNIWMCRSGFVIKRTPPLQSLDAKNDADRIFNFLTKRKPPKNSASINN